MAPKNSDIPIFAGASLNRQADRRRLAAKLADLLEAKKPATLPVPAERLLESIENDQLVFAGPKSNPLGMARWIPRGPAAVEIGSVISRQGGLGRRLVDQVLSLPMGEPRAIFMVTRSENQAMLRIATGFGFKPVTENAFSRDPELLAAYFEVKNKDGSDEASGDDRVILMRRKYEK